MDKYNEDNKIDEKSKEKVRENIKKLDKKQSNSKEFGNSFDQINISIIPPKNNNKNLYENSSFEDGLEEELESIQNLNKFELENKEKEKENEDVRFKEENYSKKADFILLKDDPKFKNKEAIFDIQNNLKEITKYETKDGIPSKYKFIDIKHEDVINFKDDDNIKFFESINFVLSEESKKRLNLLYFCIKYGFHILIPGPTGTGKTYLSEVICNLLHKNIVKYNCSENTKFPNLKFTCQGDKNKFAGIRYIKGPLLKALTSKNTAFLLDEANLAPIETLQALEAMIDSGYLAYEDKGKLIKVDVPKDFCCILTLNPSKGKFSDTRQELPESFKNKFISIEFPEMKREELYTITKGASHAFGVDKILGDESCKQFIDDFISFHMEWSKNEKIQDNVACLVIRDILAVLHIIKEGEEPTETIMNIYGARYIKPIRKEMEETLLKYKSFKKNVKKNDDIINNFPKDYYFNNNTLEVISTCLFSLKHGRYPIIAGKSGIGKKLLACKLGDYFNKHIAENEIIIENDEINPMSDKNITANISLRSKNNKYDEPPLYIIYCTKNSKVEDLIGKQKVSNNKDEDLIQWQDGPLIKAVRNGRPLILIGIHELQTSVLEYMNDLLDRKYDGKQRFLNNPNNPNEPEIPINKNFRLICTTLLSDLNKLSPAFASRMDIKILDDQLKDINENELSDLIKICMENVKTELVSYEEEYKKRLQELKGEKILENSKNNESIINISNQEELLNNNNENLNDSINSNHSNNDNNSSKSPKSEKSHNSRSSKNSGNSEDNKSNKSYSNNSRTSSKNNSGNNSLNNSFDSSNLLEMEFEFDNQEGDNYEIKMLEEREIFNENRLNNIINNQEIVLEIKKYYFEYRKIYEINMNMAFLCKFIRSTILLLFKIKYEDLEIDLKEIVKLVYNLLFSEYSSLEINEKIKENILNEKLKEDPNQQYFFNESETIKNYMISLYLYCLMNIHIYVFGPPGVGKTAGAECFARIRIQNEKLYGNYKKYAFNSSTTPSDLFGSETLMDGQIKLLDGPLIESILKGQTFIADEMNLSSNNTMMSLIPIFNTIYNRPIYFPGLQTPIKINHNFWFGAFQNYEGTAGRNATPHQLAIKLIRLDYPTVKTQDIRDICIKIRDTIYINKNLDQINISDEQILQLSNFMIELNKKKDDGTLSSAESWSIRNLENVINRMIEQQKSNNDNYIKYENCDLYINVLFYVLSYIDFESIDDSFDEILKLIENCFQLTQAQVKELKETYYCSPDLLPNDNNNTIFSLRKNKSIIQFYNSEIGNSFNFLNKIPSLLNTLFNCLLCSDTEPILLIGPTGYKTYLIKELLKKDVKIVTLNEESNIDALLGSTGFFTKEELKYFYLSLICDICFENRKILLLQDLKEGILNLKNIEIEIHQFFSPNICEKREVFKDLVKRTFKKLKDLLDNQNDDDDPNILNNIKLEFKPGLFTSAILSGKSLDLRNFDKIPTTTLERFNELFTGMKTLTLNEDKFNTITTTRNKTICKTVDFIRFFATSLSKNYSESVLSRWTVINTKEYEFEELKEVLRICANKNKFDISQQDIDYLIDLAKYFKITNRKTVSIKLLINAIELYHYMNKNLGDLKEEEKKKLYYINRQFIYYITLKSIIEQSKDDPNLSEKELNNNLYKYLFQNNEGRQLKMQIKYGESPFNFVNKNNLDGIKSLITNAFIPCSKHQPIIKPAFTTIFVEMLNIIHLGISLNEPIILEGQIGQGKQTAIKYISELLGLKLLNIQLASSNKEEDLLGKVIVDKDKKTNATIIKVNETDLMKILKNKNVDKYLIVFNDIQNASDAVKEKIANICDRHQDYILLPDGETINKPKINVICVINTDYNSDIRNKLPSPLLYSTIYHKIGEISDEDIINTTKSIFKKNFENEKMNDEKQWTKEAKDFLEKYNKVNRILIENKSKQLLTFNDINNYAKLRAATKKSFDNNLMVDNIIFYYRTQEEEYLEKIKKELNLIGFDFIPIFEYNPCHTELYIRLDKNESKGLIIKVINKDKIDVNEIKKKINTLTNYQKQCILFLACAWVTKIKVIIKGNTASGKTHCASIFAQMLGADLLIYQINQDLTPSIFNGQTILEENLNVKEIESIKSYLSEINKINSKLTQAIPSDSKSWIPSKFNVFFKKIDEIIKGDKLSEENKKLLFKAKSKISCIISPQGRFKEAESQTSLGLINGSWFLYDDIQFATSDLLSIMTPLCSEKPSINLFNAKDSPKYTSEIEYNSMNNVKLINPNFNLIMTFNPKYCKNSNGIDPIIENKCLSFNLPSNDINYESTAQIFYGGLVNSNNDYETSYQLGGKLASVHMLSKKKSLENKEFFEGDSIFTSRTINRAIKYIEKKIFEKISKGKDINLSNIIKVIIDKLYARPFIHQGFINNGEKSYQLLFREEILKNFSKEIDKYSRTYSGNEFDDNKKLLEQLRDIQIGITESKAKEFKFLEFVINSLNVKLESINFILAHIDSTLSLINNSAINLSSQHINNYYQISIIHKILNNIMKYGIKVSGKYNSCSLNDPQLLEIEQLRWPILRLKLLEKLLRDKNNKLFPQILKREYISKSTEEGEEDIFENKISMDILILISEMVKNPEISSFINLIKYINENLRSFEEIKTYINNYIPYYKFRSTNLDEISEWLPLILKCIEKNQKFKINFGNGIEYIFENNQRNEKGKFDKLNFYFTSNELKLSHHSECKIQGEKLSINKEKKDTVFRFYYFVNKILEVINLNDFILKKIKDESKKKNSFKKEKRYLYFKISNLFENNSVKNSVGKFWMVIYNMNVKSVEAFKSILTKNEQNIFNLFLRFYNNDKIEELDKFIKFTESLEFYNENLIALKLEADQYYVSQKIKKFQSSQKTEKDKYDLEILQNVSLKLEKQKFESINYYTSEIAQDKIVKLYSELIQNVEDVFIADKETKEKKELENKYDLLKKKISKLDTKKLKNISCFKDSLLAHIELISKNNEIDKDNYKLYENKYEQLEKSIKNNSKCIEQSKNNIKWPILFLDINLNKSKMCKFIENLIWYSEIKNTIDNIKINNNKEDKFKYQLKLQDYEEMKYASNLIMSTDELIDNEFNMIYATLNSHFIIKMLHDKLENYLFNSTFEINGILKNNLLLINQSDIINKNDYYYIQEKVKKLGNDFILQIPKFTSKDIVFLYIQFGSKNKKGDYEPFQGPILKQIQYNRILDVLLANKINLLNDDRGRKLAETSAKEIIYDLSKNTFKIEESFDNFSENIDTKILELKDQNIKRDIQKEKDFTKIFKITLDIARKIDKMNEKNNIELSYEDTDFLDDDKLEQIYKNIENTTKYPHLIYILNKYELMYDDLIEIYKMHKKEKKFEINKIPIWLILLRLLCNIDNIEVDYIQNNSYLSKRISENQSIYIRNLINELSNSYYNNYNVKFDYKWLNISIKQHICVFQKIKEFI